MSKTVPAITMTILGYFAAAAANADCVTGTIHTIMPWESAGAVYVEMTGAVTLQGSCPAPSTWFVQLFTDNNFRQFVYPALLMAKATQDIVTICASGCISSTYPAIDSVEYSPRI